MVEENYNEVIKYVLVEGCTDGKEVRFAILDVPPCDADAAPLLIAKVERRAGPDILRTQAGRRPLTGSRVSFARHLVTYPRS